MVLIRSVAFCLILMAARVLQEMGKSRAAVFFVYMKLMKEEMLILFLKTISRKMENHNMKAIANRFQFSF
ncbi:hypothetical protein QVD17_22187 [Tagetes erecta]|uniref:Secreted protein n=1 Tax=Tagetes erecta TaxID=13708 RepID=A0AAD8KD73_TARER|nr:hypothetical protein QVD17_22187 [Tagetes erecta]